MTLGLLEERQWWRLRSLRAERARQALATAERARADALQALRAREDRIAAGRTALRELDARRSGDWAPRLPRWAEMMGRHRERLFEQLERDEYALLDERAAATRAEEAFHRCRHQLARALARVSAVEALLELNRVTRVRAADRKSERELEDRQPPGPTEGLRHA